MIFFGFYCTFLILFKNYETLSYKDCHDRKESIGNLVPLLLEDPKQNCKDLSGFNLLHNVYKKLIIHSLIDIILNGCWLPYESMCILYVNQHINSSIQN